MSGPDMSDIESALRATLTERGFAYSRVAGTSMLPTISCGDVVLLRPCGQPRPGDIVTFVLNGRLVTHRLVRVTGGALVCRGDNRRRADPPVAGEALIGRVVRFERRHVVDRTADALRARLRWRSRDIAARCSRLGDQLALFAGALAGRQPPSVEMSFPYGVVEGADVPGASHVATSRELYCAGALAALDPRVVVVLPASLYGSLRAAERRGVLRSLPANPIDVFAVPSWSAGRAPRALGRARRYLAGVGLSAGEPGDVAARLPDGTPYVLHTFETAELARELEMSGRGEVAVVTIDTGSESLLRASLRPGRRGDRTG